MSICSERDLERFEKEVRYMTDEQLREEIEVYDKLAEIEAGYENYYACDLYVSVTQIAGAELHYRQEKALARKKVEEKRLYAAKSTIGERIPESTRQKLFALRQQLATC